MEEERRAGILVSQQHGGRLLLTVYIWMSFYSCFNEKQSVIVTVCLTEVVSSVCPV